MKKDEIKVDIETEDATENEEIQFDEKQAIDKTRELAESIKNSNYSFNYKIENLARELACADIAELHADTYLWVMYAYALKYNNGNPNAKLYIAVRMKEIIDQCMDKETKTKLLIFNKNELDKHMLNDVETTVAQVDKQIKKMRKTYAILEIILAVLFVLLVVTLTGLNPFIAILIAVIVVGINYFLSFGNIVKRMKNEQAMSSRQYCKDHEIKEFAERIIF